nr:tetratricopeptide repeat protein [Candidatus Sigynarchaeota archaeon]
MTTKKSLMLMKAAEEVLRLDPKNVKTWSDLGKIRDKQKDYKGAADAYEKAVEFYPFDDSVWLKLGKIRVKLMDYKGAAEAFEKAAKILPGRLNTGIASWMQERN